ncbi:hypothetical protein J2046_006030 [Rhizobium petrolearium]|nr:hypothetical protein [Neorhizobium petrolearium]
MNDVELYEAGAEIVPGLASRRRIFDRATAERIPVLGFHFRSPASAGCSRPMVPTPGCPPTGSFDAYGKQVWDL